MKKKETEKKGSGRGVGNERSVVYGEKIPNEYLIILFSTFECPS